MWQQKFSFVSIVVRAIKVTWYYLFGEITNFGVFFWGSISVSTQSLSFEQDSPLGGQRKKGRRLEVREKILENTVSEKVSDN